MTLGQRISTYRKQLGISQEALGERLGVSRQAVSKWETDAAAPDMANLIALAREFGVSGAELTETPEPETVWKVSDSSSSSGSPRISVVDSTVVSGTVSSVVSGTVSFAASAQSSQTKVQGDSGVASA